jgi:hypothetical protein
MTSPGKTRAMVGDLDLDPSCYVTATGRRTGRAHTSKIWFAARDRTLYVVSGIGSSVTPGRPVGNV